MSDLIIALCVIGYLMIGVFVITLLVNFVFDGAFDGLAVFMVVVWPLALIILVILGLIVAPYCLAKFISGKIDGR